MKDHRSITRLLSLIALAVALAIVPESGAQTIADASQPSSSTQSKIAQPSASDLASRIDDLEKQIVSLRGQLAAQKTEAAVVADVPAQAATSTTAPAAAPAPPTLGGLLGPTTLSGFVDVYYGYNANQPANRNTSLRNFDVQSGQFGLNMIELVADKSPDPAASHVGYHVALGFGQAINLINASEPAAPAAAAASGTETNFDQYLKEGYLEYLAGKKLQINFGKFVTPAGAEVIESKDNWNYSRGDLFALAIPYFHFGVSAKYTFNPKFALTGYLVNGWNNSIDNNSGKTTGFSAAWTPNAKFSLTQNYLVGPEQFNNSSDFRHLFDTVVSYNATPKLSFLGNFDYGHDDAPGAIVATPNVVSGVWWSGVAGYVKYAPNANWYWAARGEYYNDHNGFTTGTLGTPDHLSEFTFTLQRLLASKIMARAEYRYDHSDQNVFAYRANQFGPIDHRNTITIGMIYAFSSADAK